MSESIQIRTASAWYKYAHVIGIGLQNTLVYRVNFFFRAAFSLIPLTGTLFLWQAIYAGKTPGSKVGAYSLSDMITYYLLVTMIDALTSVVEDDWQIAADIKDGNISQFLLKPIDYLSYRLCLYLANRTIYSIASMIPVIAFVAWMHQYFVLPADVASAVFFAVSVFLAAMLQFFIAYSLALLAFWVLDVSTFIFIQFALEYIASGHLFPLDILPAGWGRVLAFLPYPYLLHFPASIYLGRIQGADRVSGLLIQMGWVAGGYVLARWAWSRGIRKYSAAGG